MIPLYLKFSTGKNKYVYDTITNKIFKVDGLVYDILDDFFVLTREKIIQQYSKKQTVSEIQNAIKKISGKIKKEGLFFQKRTVKMKLPVGKERLVSFYDGDLEDLILNMLFTYQQ